MGNKLKNKIFGSTDLLYEEDEIQYEINAMMNVSEKKFGQYGFASLTFWKDKGMKSEKVIEVWDNDEYLYNKLFLKVLMPLQAGLKCNMKEFRHLSKIDGFEQSHLKGLRKLFQKAISLGIFDEVIKK
jgi:phage-related tail protein